MKKNQIDIITMGCSKNLVDSELLMKQFEANGYHCVHDSKRPQGEIAVQAARRHVRKGLFVWRAV